MALEEPPLSGGDARRTTSWPTNQSVQDQEVDIDDPELVGGMCTFASGAGNRLCRVKAVG
jgi:hypothetical protein